MKNSVKSESLCNIQSDLKFIMGLLEVDSFIVILDALIARV